VTLHFADDYIIKTVEEHTPLRNAQPTSHTPRDILHTTCCCSLIANTNLLSAQKIDSINVEELSSFFAFLNLHIKARKHSRIGEADRRSVG